jgi:flagellar basal body-associated protein FliL
VQKRSGQGRWITISILAVLLIAAVASFFVIRYVSRSTPDKTLDAFCNALQQADYRSAYDQFSIKLQHTVSEAAFATALSQDKVTACTHGTTGDSANSVTNDLKLVHASKGINNDIVTLTKDSNNDWKIDDIYRQT